MYRTVVFTTAVLVFSVATTAVWADEGTNDEALYAAKELLVASGAGKLGMQIMDHMITAQKQALPQVPAKFWEDFRAEVNPNELIDMIAPVYVRHLSVDEMKEITAFYKSPVGMKLVGKLPVITQESMAAGQQWGMQLGMKVAKKLAEQSGGQ